MTKAPGNSWLAYFGLIMTGLGIVWQMATTKSTLESNQSQMNTKLDKLVDVVSMESNKRRRIEWYLGIADDQPPIRVPTQTIPAQPQVERPPTPLFNEWPSARPK